jgi:hypothetical protein
MFTNCGVAASYGLRQSCGMLDTDELLARLADKGIRNVDIARVLELPDSRVPEIKRKDRRLTLDEGAKLVRAFELEQENRRTPIPVATLRLIVRYVAEEVGIRPEDQQVQELSEDLRAFSEFVADPKVFRSMESAEAFFQALRFRRPKSAEEARPKTDPHRAS